MEQYSYENAICQANKHKLVHQYTNFNALENIINNKSLRLTRIDLLNDAIENTGMIKLWQKKVFVSCFTHREHESYFFWKTYSKEDLFGVMISLNPNFFNSLTIHTDEKCEDEPLYPCDRTVPGVVFSPNISTESWGVYDFSFIGVKIAFWNNN